MSDLEQAKQLLMKVDNALTEETNRVQNSVRSIKSKRTGLDKLEELSLYAAKLFEIQGQLAEAKGMLEEGDIAHARWHKARRRK